MSKHLKSLIKIHEYENIVQMLLEGKSIHYISCQKKVDIETILNLFSDVDFSAKCLELFKNRAKGFALIGHNNIARIAFSPDSSEATQLKASKYLVDIARELDQISPHDLDPAHMSQDQLIERLKALQKETVVRAKPVDTGVIEHKSSTNLEDMLD